jgi:hypothetical protein
MEVNGQHHVPAALPPEKSPVYPLYSSLRASQSRSGRCGDGKNLARVRIRTPSFR